MSSLHQDRLLVEGSEPVSGTAAALPTARGTSRRAVGTTEKKATSTVPTQRLGTAQRGGTTQSTAVPPAAPRATRAAGAKAAAVTGALASRAKAATVKAATAKAATAKAATVKVATAKAATARAATAKAATAARAAAVTTVANHTAGVRSARAAAAAKATPPAKARATKAAPSKAAPAKSAPAKTATAKTATAKTATAKTATAKTATAKTAQAATVAVSAPAAKSAAVKPAAAKAATAKPAPVAKAAEKAAPAAKPAAATTAATKAAPAAKPAAAKAAPVAKAARAASEAKAAKSAPTVKPAIAKPSRATATPADASAAGAAPRVRPTPHKRVPTVQAALAGSVPLADVADLTVTDTADVVVVRKDLPTAAASGGRLPLFLRRLPMARRRPALYLSAALVGAISLSAFASEAPTERATATMNSVSVAEQLGIEAAPTASVGDGEATARLSELAASRNTRDAEQAAAMQVQAEADRIAVEAAIEAARPDAVMPVQGARLTSGFGARWGTLHAGIDLAAPMHTPEYAVMDGVVLEAGPASGFGLAIYIQHESGDVTVYGHMDKILVEAGQVVKAGDTIALLGNRGQSTGPHLHFEVHVGGLDGQKVDPLPWLRQAGVGI